MVPLATRYRPLRILCIEEDPIQRKLLEACLDVIDAESLFAPRAAQALWQFRRHPVDIVMMDLDWHVKEEIAAFEEMKKTPRWGAHVPIVAVTDNVCNWTEADYRDAGFAALYLKPIAPIRLFAKIDDVLRDHHQPPLLLGPAYGRALSHTA